MESHGRHGFFLSEGRGQEGKKLGDRGLGIRQDGKGGKKSGFRS